MAIKIFKDFFFIINIIFLFILFFSCNSEEKPVFDIGEYGYDVGDIAFDPAQDDPSFKLCSEPNNIYGRGAIVLDSGNAFDILQEQFVFSSEYSEFSGFIMIRFIMNCNGETGRFRTYPMNFDFSPNHGPSSLINQILDLVTDLKGWRHRHAEHQDQDCTKYINFKIQNGKIDAIIE